jgi:hypothetical protein
MRSYYEHLETAAGVHKTAVLPHPTVRSSAIFPVLNQPDISTRLLFMGYWILKRHIHEILAVINLRSSTGELLGRQVFTINQAKTYRIELKEQLALAGFSSDTPFMGSLEIEFFSTVNLVFPYPAVVVNYYGPKFSTVVHTAQRVYNDFEDLARNSQTAVPESGFNIYADEEREPFIALINGTESVEDAPISVEFFNCYNQTMQGKFWPGKLHPYETRFFYPAREFKLKEFLNGQPGAAKIHFQVNWIFPRLVVGNIQHNLPAVTITHTYYDTSRAKQESDYWRPTEERWHPASLMVPAVIKNNHFTNIYFYPIYSPSAFAIDLELYTEDGKLAGKEENALVLEAPFQSLYRIEIKPLAQQFGLNPDLSYGARLIARTLKSSRLPARIKIGLDIGADPSQMPCNICTNLQPFNPQLESKPTAFRWGPVLTDQPEAVLWIMNSAPHVHYTRASEVEVTFYREEDTETRKQKINLPPHGFVAIYPNQDSDLQDFFHGKIGWFTAIASNPYTSTYYFTENLSGIVGGDHGF